MRDRAELNIVSRMYVNAGIVVIVIGLVFSALASWSINQASQDLFNGEISTDDYTELILSRTWFKMSGDILIILGLTVLIYGVYRRLGLIEFDISEIQLPVEQAIEIEETAEDEK